MTRIRLALLTAGSPDRMTGGHLFHRRLAERAATHGVDFAVVSIPPLPLPWAILTGPWWRNEHAIRSADVIVLDSLAAAAAAPWLIGLEAPVIGMLHQAPGGMDAGALARALRGPFDRWAYRRAALLLVASEWLRHELTRSGPQRAPLRVVPPGKDVAASLDPDAQPAGRADLRRGRRMAAVCVSNWLPRKGIGELLEAIAGLPDDLVTLHLVGDTAADAAYARRIRARLAKPDLRGRVAVHGVMAPANVRAMYAYADAFVLPSFVEPYGTVWGEAMASGLPVAGWRAGNLPYLADDGREGLLVPVGDIGALGRAIERLARDDELRHALGAAAARRAADRPTWDETATTFFGLVREVVTAHRPTRAG